MQKGKVVRLRVILPFILLGLILFIGINWGPQIYKFIVIWNYLSGSSRITKLDISSQASRNPAERIKVLETFLKDYAGHCKFQLPNDTEDAEFEAHYYFDDLVPDPAEVDVKAIIRSKTTDSWKNLFAAWRPSTGTHPTLIWAENYPMRIKWITKESKPVFFQHPSFQNRRDIYDSDPYIVEHREDRVLLVRLANCSDLEP